MFLTHRSGGTKSRGLIWRQLSYWQNMAWQETRGVCISLSAPSLCLFLKICLLKSQSYRDRGKDGVREREGYLPSAGSLPLLVGTGQNSGSGPGCEARSFFQVARRSSRGPSTKAIRMELWHNAAPTSNDSIESGNLTYYATMAPSLWSYIKTAWNIDGTLIP